MHNDPNAALGVVQLCDTKEYECMYKVSESLDKYQKMYRLYQVLSQAQVYG